MWVAVRKCAFLSESAESFRRYLPEEWTDSDEICGQCRESSQQVQSEKGFFFGGGGVTVFFFLRKVNSPLIKAFFKIWVTVKMAKKSETVCFKIETSLLRFFRIRVSGWFWSDYRLIWNDCDLIHKKGKYRFLFTLPRIYVGFGVPVTLLFSSRSADRKATSLWSEMRQESSISFPLFFIIKWLFPFFWVYWNALITAPIRVMRYFSRKFRR